MQDVIVVGAGSAGATLAARLCDEGARVMLLEAGPAITSKQMPADMLSPNSWRPYGSPESRATFTWPGLLARRTPVQEPLPYFRGRGTGGSSLVNGQIAIRAIPDDFQSWQAAGPLDLWSWTAVESAYARLEDDEEYGDHPGHGRGGPIPVHRSSLDEWGPVDRLLARTAESAGQPWSDDVNAATGTGISRYPINNRQGRRVTVNDGYLEPQRAHPYLTVLGGCTVDRVLFEGNRAVGVSVLRDGVPEELWADEVVVCGGAVHTPTVLLRSGIGLEESLSALGVQVRSCLPVGKHALEHPMFGITLALRRGVAMTDLDARHTNCVVRTTSGLLGTGLNDMMTVSLNHENLAPTGLLGIVVNQAFSEGEVTLRDLDPLALPEVELNVLDDRRDLVRLRQSVRQLWDDLHSAGWSDVAETVELMGGGDPTRLDDSALDHHLLQHVGDAQHICGTARMGEVVDQECKVLGVAGLRVIDASVFPTIPRANLHLTVVMLAERMARWMGEGR